MNRMESRPLFSRRSWLWGLFVTAVAVAFWVLPPLAARQEAAFRSFAPLVDIKSQIQRNYVEDVDDHRLVEGAIRGMVSQLDQHCEYFNPAEYVNFKEKVVSGSYVGIGIVFERDDDHVVVVNIIENSPAYEAGVRVGDVIVEVGNRNVEAFSSHEVLEMLLGIEGSFAHFKVRRPPNGELISFSVKRQKINRRTVCGFRRRTDDPNRWDYMIDPDAKIGYIRIVEFWDNTTPEFEEAMADLQSQDVRGLILDVRFNGGGDVDVVLNMLDRFIADGVLLTTRNRREVVTTHVASGRNVLPTSWPVAVLVNEHSASGAEILSGVLQYYKRAVLVGEQTYGKGSVQTFIPLNNDTSALKITTAYYFLPDGRCIHKRPGVSEYGVMPDIVVPLDQDMKPAIFDSWGASGVIHNEAGGIQTSILIDPQLERALQYIRESLRTTH